MGLPESEIYGNLETGLSANWKMNFGQRLFILQFLLCGALVSLGFRPLLDLPFLWPFAAIGVAIMGAGVWAMKKINRKISVAPEPAADALFCEVGIYRFIRHPMYSGLLVAMVPFAIAMMPWPPWGLLVWMLLLIVLIQKLRLEEILLREKFPEYAKYQTQTKRLIPFVW